MVGKNKTDFRPNLSNKALEPLFVQMVYSHQLIPCYKRSHTKELLVRAKKATIHAVQPVKNKHNWIEHNQKFYYADMLLIMLKCQKWTFYLPVQSDKFHSKHSSEATKSSLLLSPPPPSLLRCSARHYAARPAASRRFMTIAVKSSWKICFFSFNLPFFLPLTWHLWKCVFGQNDLQRI